MPALQHYQFGDFVLAPDRRLLLRHGTPVELSARAFDILQCLLEARDRVVGRDELMAHAWPGLVVEPSNLTVQMSGLRRALQDTGRDPTIIATVTGRGYRFIAPVSSVQDEDEAPPISPRRYPVRRQWQRKVAWAIVAAGIGAGLLANAWWRPGQRPSGAGPQRLSIAVLPFRNLSNDPSRNDLADAIGDDLTTDLSRLPGTLVIARESADTFKGRAVPAPDIGRALGVRYLLEGSLAGEGHTLRINAQLIEAETGGHVWAQRFDIDDKRRLDAQSEVVRRLAAALDIALVDAAAATLPRDTAPADAQATFLRARALWHRASTRAEFTATQRLLEATLAADPDHIEALALLGWLLVRKTQSFDYADSDADLAEAGRAIDHALSLAPANPSVLAARGRLLAATDRCDEARAAFETALAADPASVLALTGQALCAWRTGHPDQAIAPLQAALRIDPLGPAANRRFETLGLAALFAGDAGAAIPWLLRADAQDTETPADLDTATPAEDTRLYLIAAYQRAGNHAEASRRAAAFMKTYPRRSIWRHRTLLNRAQSAVPAAPAIFAALAAAGIPSFADEGEDLHVRPTLTPIAGGEFTPLPRSVPGARTIQTEEAATLLKGATPPLALDAGAHLAVPAGAAAAPDTLATESPAAIAAMPFAPRLRTGPTIILGTGPSGPDGYNAALHLAALGYPNLLWYRGGEESWAAHGLPNTDQR